MALCVRLPAQGWAQSVESGPGGPEHRYGLRVARWMDPRTVRLILGSSFVTRVGTQPAAYRIVSATDPNFRQGLRASAVRHTAAPDDSPPAGWRGKSYERHVVTLTLPRPLRAGCRYAVQVLGINGQPVTGGRAAAWIEPMTDATEQRAAAQNRLGIRRIELLAPTVIQVTVGDSFDAAGFDGHPESIVLQCRDDPDFRTGRRAVRIGRRSRGDCFQTDGWPYGYYLVHELFAVFDAPLKQGRTYTLDLNAVTPLTGAGSRASLTVEDKRTLNPAIKVNQVGYLPNTPRKRAYVGAWMGSLGALDYGPWATRFEVRDAASHALVLSGPVRLRHRVGDRTEGYYHEDLSGENVYEMDFSALKTEGRYYVVVPGMGRSFAFRIARDVYVQPFRVMMNGVLHQRCGIEMKPPYSIHYRPACHRDRTELTDLSRGSESEAFQELPKHVISPVKHDLYGGHHDAGDYNPRSHLDVAELAFLAYEVNPAAFYDGQLRIPEAGNGIPDILDEGRWALDLWVRLQDSDGGVRDGTESDGDPDQITLAEEDTKRDFAFAKDAGGSLRFAATAAQASLIWNGLGRRSDARELLDRAVRAWNWAGTHGAEGKPDALILAAIQLYRATGEPKYRTAFERHTVFSRKADADLDVWQQYDQRDASFYYAFCRRPVDAVLKQRILDAFRRRMETWIRWAETEAYPYLRNPQAPNVWGTGAHPIWLVDAIEATTLLHDPKYRTWIVLTCDWALGCNPMGTVFTTRLGQRRISSPLHMYSRYSPDGPIAGIQCEGPSPRTGGEKAASSMGTWIGAMLYPLGPWPPLQTYSDVGMCPEMNEDMVSNQMKSAVAYAFLLPLSR
ncbi:MAG TPA: glycoside hydrolase family 9 protein [Chthonomonadaceae bacterium]|nr:glycoside hydrolase family 9 protein [Chthonomonadaceae bacterium]